MIRPSSKASARLAAKSPVASHDRHQTAADLRQKIADQHHEIDELRSRVMRDQVALAVAKAELGMETEKILREANERLVIATIRAQTMSETAEQATAQMSFMAEHDFLTCLPNRSLLSQRLAQSIALAERHGKKVALLYLDLDHFKHINDSMGHAVGDLLLQSVAQRLQACVRQSDTVCRQGGDEFVVLLAEIDAACDATVSAEKLLQSLSVPHLINGHQLRVTPSIGIAIYPDDGKDIDAILRNADIAMYRAKKKDAIITRNLRWT